MLDLRTAPLSDTFGTWAQWRKDAGLSWHPADDLPSPLGSPIAAPDDGEVVYTGFGWTMGTLGYYTIFDAGDYGLLMAHQDQKYPELLGPKKKGDVIGYSGNTGWSTGPHVHLIMSIKRHSNGFFDFSREGGALINPRLYFNTQYNSGVFEDMFYQDVPVGKWFVVTRRVITSSELSLLDRVGVSLVWRQGDDGLWSTYSPDGPDFLNASWPAFIQHPAPLMVVRN